MPTFEASAKIMLKKGILDVQGKTVENALKTLNLSEISNVRIGKYITFLIEADSLEKASSIANEACDKLLHNPNIETYEFQITSKDDIK
jgi:phosphoribosylformylglycinamidine synthase